MTAHDLPRERPVTVLFAEDDADVRLVVGMVLRRAGMAVVEATDGRGAVAVLGERPGDIDVVLLDVMMPVMTGPEALPELRRIVPDLPVVFYSGFDRGEVGPHLSEGPPVTSFLPKPSDHDVLVAELLRAAGRDG